MTTPEDNGQGNPPASQRPQLEFEEYNTTSNETIVFIHGALVTSRNWASVLPFVPDRYHVLVPTLPAHGPCSHIQPFSLDLAAELIADLIREHAKKAHAHIVGLSLGASVAIHLASTYPDCVQDVFVSGYTNYKPSNKSMPFWFWFSHQVEYMIPSPVVRWLMDGTDMPKPDLSIAKRPLCEDICDALFIPTESIKPWPARTLIVAATKAGILPTGDNVEDAVALRDVGRRRNKETKAVKHTKMRHPFHIQNPELFAGTAIAWFERRGIDASFGEL